MRCSLFHCISYCKVNQSLHFLYFISGISFIALMSVLKCLPRFRCQINYKLSTKESFQFALVFLLYCTILSSHIFSGNGSKCQEWSDVIAFCPDMTSQCCVWKNFGNGQRRRSRLVFYLEEHQFPLLWEQNPNGKTQMGNKIWLWSYFSCHLLFPPCFSAGSEISEAVFNIHWWVMTVMSVWSAFANDEIKIDEHIFYHIYACGWYKCENWSSKAFEWSRFSTLRRI